MNRLLMIAYMFPPAGGIGIAGAQRVLKFLKFLPNENWQPIILTVQPTSYESFLAMDPTLESKVSPDTLVIRTSVFRGLTWVLNLKKKITNRGKSQSTRPQAASAPPRSGGSSSGKGWYQSLKDSFTDLFEIPDEEMGWLFPAIWAGFKTIKSQRIDVIYATGRPWSAFLIGRALKALTGKPLVVDFRDPWMTNPFRLSYSPFKDRIETFLERKVVEGADLVIANTAMLREEFVMRFPTQDHSKFVTVWNGFDPGDFAVENTSTGSDSRTVFTLTHTGFLYGKRDPQGFLLGLQSLLRAHRIDSQKIKVQFVGAIGLDYNLQEYLVMLQLEHVVTLFDHMPFQESLQFLKKADGLLLLQPGTATQIPSKLFEYIGLGKPILAICPHKSATEQLMEEESLGVVVHPEQADDIAEAIYTLFQNWETGVEGGFVHSSRSEKFNVQVITSDLAKHLASINR